MNSKGMKTCVNSHGSETNHRLTSNGCHTQKSIIQKLTEFMEKKLYRKIYVSTHIATDR